MSSSLVEGLPHGMSWRTPGLKMLRPDQLVPGRFQPRSHFNQKALLELAQSFLENDLGIIEPIVVRPKAGDVELYEIVAGERRWRAGSLVKLELLPCLVRNFTDLQALQAGLVENDQREDLNSLERARGYQMAIDEFELTHDALGQMLGASRVVITNHLRLFSLPLAVQELLEDGQLSESKVRCLYGLNAAAAVRIARVAAEQRLGYRQIELLARAEKKPAKPTATPARDDPDERRWLDVMSQRLGHETTLEKATKGKGGYLRIRYTTMDDLSSITKKLLKGHD
ncbi:chromosome partitioning protein ParB [Pseudomonas sp. FW306-1C-G01A]|nr:chromosome partitioning protein ParB [Pseudomonas sp. GW101-1A09]PMV94449.1 chromosome partitioning protein ParB [Pseudomonas sp. FW306-2-2C-B10A]PMW04347.1 chromosome partitioning protein ParB [Pseudomonas sp. MPR-TSA4]PMW11470.1 chromosome partitioning protein ParB [Pseudomonas sp. FW306-2-1A-C05A]PMW33363.1 chromosome partitioning protein ParB [Pseudomonas sp. FW305-3-2-15-A-R2A1]PMW35821.1 chromosome partitioning protein ParB [Pseudomonas sp. MPR-E5]PMW49310.1 chromosome partitioning p